MIKNLINLFRALWPTKKSERLSLQNYLNHEKNLSFWHIHVTFFLLKPFQISFKVRSSKLQNLILEQLSKTKPILLKSRIFELRLQKKLNQNPKTHKTQQFIMPLYNKKQYNISLHLYNPQQSHRYNRFVSTSMQKLIDAVFSPQGEESVIKSILDASIQISNYLRHSPIIVLQTQNNFGDTQLHQDVHCDQVIEKHLRKNHLVNAFASQERPHYMEISEGQGYVVTYDPLDGSSVVDTNFSIGCIFSIWKTTPSKLIGETLRTQVNAVISIFGPRTTAIYHNKKVNKVQELTAVQDKWIVSHDHLTIKPKTKIFSPGNLRSASDNEEYRKAILQWMEKGYTLRYTGSLVVDVYQIFIKGHGIFSNCGSTQHKVKLRAIYEAAALGYLIEKAGGKTITSGKGSLLDFKITGYYDIVSFAVGSQEEVDNLAHLF